MNEKDFQRLSTLKFASNTPEWQLQQNIVGAYHAAAAYQKDMIRAQELYQKSLEKIELYSKALEKLQG